MVVQTSCEAIVICPGGPRAPLLYFLYGPALQLFPMVCRLILGPYVMSPFMFPTYLLSQVASSRFPFPLLKPSWLPSWDSTGVGSYPHIPLNPRPCPGPWPKTGLYGLAGGYQLYGPIGPCKPLNIPLGPLFPT